MREKEHYTAQHVLVEHGLLEITHCSNKLDFPQLNSCLFNIEMYPFVQQIRKFNTESSNCSTLLTNKIPYFTKNKTNLERKYRNLVFVLLKQVTLATMGPNHNSNGVNNLSSRPASKTINSCIDTPLYRQPYLTF